MKTTAFKMTELGPIPGDWEVKRLGEIGAFKNGISKGTESFGHGVPFVNLLDVFGKSRLTSVEGLGLVEVSHAEIADCGLKHGDTLFVRSSVKPEGVGLATVIDGELHDTVFSGFLLRYRTDALETRYKQYAFAEASFRQRVIASSTVSANTNINQPALKNLFVALPPLPEQHRIAAALSDVDELIGTLGKLVEKKRAIKTGAMQRLLTGQTRLPGFGGKEFKQTELGPIPSDWEVKRLGETFSMLRNNTYARESLTDDGGKVFNVHYGDILVKYGAIVNFEMDEVPCLKAGIKPNKDMLQDGDLIFADTAEDEMVGKAVEVAGVNGRQAVAGLHTILCRPYSDTFAHGFLGYFVNSAAYHNQLLPLITGTKVSSVSRAGFASTYVCIPSLPEQRAIAAVLSDMDAEIAALEAEQAKYTRIKSGMMQELLTGRTRLR